MYNVQLSSQILFSQLHVSLFKSFGSAVEWFIIVGRIQCVIIVFNYLLSIFILLGGRLECRICKWKLLFSNRTFVAAFAMLTSFRDVGPSQHVRKISFVASYFIYDEEVTIKKRKSVLGHFAATEACIRFVFAFSRSSEMSICPSVHH